MGRTEKADIVNDEREPLLALLSAPADEGITGFDFPGCSGKEYAGQVPSVTVSKEVAQVLARGAAVAQVVMLPQMPNKGVGLASARLNRDDLQRLQRPKWTLDQVPASRTQRKEFGLPERTQNPPSAPALPRRQLDEPAFTQLLQQQSGRHVFELSARGAPVEHFAQCDREPPPTPLRMLGHQPSERFQII